MTEIAAQRSIVRPATQRPVRQWRAALGQFVRHDVRATVVGLVAGAVVWQLLALLIHAEWLPTFLTVGRRCLDLLGDPGDVGMVLRRVRHHAVAGTIERSDEKTIVRPGAGEENRRGERRELSAGPWKARQVRYRCGYRADTVGMSFSAHVLLLGLLRQ